MELAMNEYDLSVLSKNSLNHLWKAGKLAESFSPELSRFYVHQMQELSRNNQISLQKNEQFCVHCGTLWTGGGNNFSVRLKPRPVLTKRLRFLFRSSTHLLTSRQRKLVAKLKNKSNQMVYHCKVCQKRASYSGRKRLVMPQSSTPRAGSMPQTQFNSPFSSQKKTASSHRKRSSLLRQVLEKEKFESPQLSSRQKLKDFLRSV